MRPELRALALGALFALIAVVPAVAWQEPARGTPTRAAILDAVRPLAVAELGSPIEFMVHSIRVSGDRAFVSVWAQRPGGVQIDMRRTPMGRREGWHDILSEGPGIQALLRRSRGAWVVADHALGATDVWWSEPRLCAEWRAVIADACP